MPDSAVELEVSSGIQTFRQMVIAALKQVLKDRRLALPLGPESALDDENRLVMLNRFAVQLAPAGQLVPTGRQNDSASPDGSHRQVHFPVQEGGQGDGPSAPA